MNDFIQDNNSQCDLEITLAEQEQICFVELLPEELIFKIVKFCITRCKDERELGAVIACLQRINIYFNQIINNDVRLQIYIIEKFENIKKHFFATQAIVYPRMPHKVNKNAITLFSKTNLPEKITNFSTHKASYIKFIKKRKKMNNNALSLELINAVKLGKLDLVWLLIYKISAINFGDFNDDTLLMHAALNGHKEIAELLISKGAEVNSKNTNCETAFIILFNLCLIS